MLSNAISPGYGVARLRASLMLFFIDLSFIIFQRKATLTEFAVHREAKNFGAGKKNF